MAFWDWSTIAGLGPEGYGAGVPSADPTAPDFSQRFGAAFPATGMSAPPPSPISPEMLAKNLAARGVPPPPVDATPPGAVGAALTGTSPAPDPIRVPSQEDMDAWRMSVDAANGGAPTPQGYGATPASPAPTSFPNAGGAPTDIRPPAAQGGNTDVSSQGKDKGSSLADTLRGVKAPPAPEIQRLGTPAAPRPTTQIKGGNLLAILEALGANQQTGGLKLPQTLGAALTGRG